MNRKMFSLLVSFVMFSLVFFCTAHADAASVIKLGHDSAPGSSRDLGAQKFKEIVEAGSKGDITVEIYPSSQLGAGSNLIQGMQMGSVEMGILPSSYLGGLQALTTIMDIPFLFPDDYHKLMAVEAGPAGAALKALTEKAGIKTLDIWHTGYKTFTASKPLNSPADFKGLKFRVMPSPIQAAQYETVGAAGVNMAFSEAYTALQNGALDGQENPLDTTYDMKFHEVQKYVTISRHAVLDQFIMAGKKWYDSLDEPTKQLLMEGVAAGRGVALQNTLRSEKIALEAFKNAGVTIKELTPEERVVWAKAFAPVREVYVKRYGKDAQTMLDLFEKEIAKE